MDIQSIGSAASQKPITILPETSSTAPPQATTASAAVAHITPPAASAAQTSEAVKNINAALESLAPNLQFSVDTDSNRTIVKVIDQETQEVIRQMPTAEALEIAKALDKVQGLLIRQKA